MIRKEIVSHKRLWLEATIVTVVLLLLVGLIPLGWGIDWPAEFWIKQGIFALILTVTYFINGLYFIPTYLLKNKLWKYSLLILASVSFILIIMPLIEQGLGLPRIMHEIFRPEEPFRHQGWFRFNFQVLLMTLLTFGLSTSIVLVRKAQQDTLLRQELEKQQVSTELSLLKAQINPHFFFNTLNNIYALTTLNVELAQKAIHMLSAMMRYVLYDSRKEYVLVSQEIKFLENYIELMKIRLPNKAKVTFLKPDVFQDELIAPMMLLPYVENAFKHGVSSQIASEIKIQVKLQSTRLHLYVENTIFHSNALNLEGSGIGLTNTQRRLELLYPGRHEVRNEKQGEQYIVNFSIDLKQDSRR